MKFTKMVLIKLYKMPRMPPLSAQIVLLAQKASFGVRTPWNQSCFVRKEFILCCSVVPNEKCSIFIGFFRANFFLLISGFVNNVTPRKIWIYHFYLRCLVCSRINLLLSENFPKIIASVYLHTLMAIRVVEISSREYKIRKIFA